MGHTATVQVNIREVRHKRRGQDISGPFVSQLGHVTLPIFQFLLGKPEDSNNITDCWHSLNTKILSEISETAISKISPTCSVNTYFLTKNGRRNL